MAARRIGSRTHRGASQQCRGIDRAPLPTLSARTVLITLPLAVLKAGVVRFDPALPAKQRALAGLEMGQVFKIVLRFREAFWEQPEFLKERRAKAGSDGRGLNFVHSHGAEVPTWWTSLPARSPGRWTGRSSLPAKRRTAPKSGRCPEHCRAGDAPRARCCARSNSHASP